MTMRFRLAWVGFGLSALLVGAVGVIQSAPASAAARQGPDVVSGSAQTPTITKVAPSSGTTSGNTVVTITGTNLAHASSVTFGTRASASIVAASSTKLTVIDPSLGTGSQDVIVNLPNGHTSARSVSDRFTYVTAPGRFPSAITGTFTDNFTFGDDDAPVPPAETSTTGSFILKYAAPSCPSEQTDGLDAACYDVTSVSGTGFQACYPPDNSSATLEPFSFETDAANVTARIQVDAAGVYHLYFDLFAPSAADGPVTCPQFDHDQNSVIALFHDPDGLNSATADAYKVGQGSETVNVQDNGEDQDFGNGITAPGWSGSATFAFTYGPSLVLSGTPAGGTVGTKYLDTSIAVSGGTSPYALTATGLPPGLAISSSGTISGTPTLAGTYNPTITATDSSKPARAGTETPTIVVAQGSPTLTLSASPASPQASGTTVTLTAKITGTAAGTPDQGHVSLSSDGQAITCITTTVAKNKLICTTTAGTFGATGGHSLVATVAADANYNAATSAPLHYRVT